MLRILRDAAIVLALSFGAAGLLASAASRDLEETWSAPGPAAEPVDFVVEPGWSLSRAASELGDAGLVWHPEIFVFGARLDGRSRDLRAGEYRVPAGSSMDDLLTLLTEGPTLQHSFTLPEGLTVRQALARLAADPVLEGAITLSPPEGSLLPETYRFPRGATRDGTIARMRALRDETLEELWRGRAEGLPLESPGEAVVLASMIQREAGREDEMPLVASVFVNRLRRGARLQSDPTVIYALTGGAGSAALGRELTRGDLEHESPYNTYLVEGLPPGPISNPGRAALAAAMRPAETDLYYFVSDGEGGHRFAEDLAGHNENVRAFRALRDERRRAGGEEAE